MKKDISIFDIVISIYNTLVHMFIAVVFLFVIYFAVHTYKDYETLRLHVVFKSLGFLFIMMEAIMSLQAENSWSRLISRKYKRIVHLCLQTIGCGFIIAGFVLIVKFRSGYEEGLHFQSAHGIVGLTAFIFSMISMINGIGAFIMPNFGNRFRSVGAKLVHTFTGIVAVVLALVAMMLVMNTEKFIGYFGTNVFSIVATVFLALCAFYIVIKPVLNMISYLKSLRSTTV